MERLVAVTFDFWSTVAVPEVPGTRAARRAAISEVFERHGASIDQEALDRVFDETVDTFNEAWAQNRQFTAYDAAAHTVRRLARDLPERGRQDVIDAFVESARSVPVELAPGIAPALSELRSAGVRLAIICDVGLTPSTILREYLEANDVLALFDHFSFSDEVGVYKPAAAMFADALEGLGGVTPSRAAHVGDLLRTDVVGARSFGMRSVRYSGVFDDSASLSEVAEADHVVVDHGQLPEVLDLT